LIVLCGAIFMLLLDTTIVNVAQQKIKEGLGADLSQMQWVLDSYILTYAVLLLSFGRMGDVYGRSPPPPCSAPPPTGSGSSSALPASTR
jgi:MFS family permease